MYVHSNPFPVPEPGPGAKTGKQLAEDSGGHFSLSEAVGDGASPRRSERFLGPRDKDQTVDRLKSSLCVPDVSVTRSGNQGRRYRGEKVMC